MSKLKAFADDENLSLLRVENIVVTDETAGYKHFLLVQI